MSDLSHVSMEQNQCFICGTVQDTGAILLDKRLRASLKPKTLTGYAPCDECKAKLTEGYIALVEAKTSKFGRDMLRSDEAIRTGNIVWIRRAVYAEIFQRNEPVDDKGKPLPMVFIDETVIPWLQANVIIPEEGDADDAPVSH